MDVIIQQEPRNLFLHSKSSSSSSNCHHKTSSSSNHHHHNHHNHHHHHRNRSRSNSRSCVNNNHIHSKRKSRSKSSSLSPSPPPSSSSADIKNIDIKDDRDNSSKQSSYSRSRSRSRSNSRYAKKQYRWTKSNRGRSRSRSNSSRSRDSKSTTTTTTSTTKLSNRDERKKYKSSNSRKDRSSSKESRKRYKSRSRSRSRDRSRSYDSRYKRRKSNHNSRSRSRERSRRRHYVHKGRSRSRSPSPSPNKNKNNNDNRHKSKSSSRNNSLKKKSSRWSQNNTMIEKLLINTCDHSNNNNQDNQSRIYVGSLHFSLTEEDIKLPFLQFGNIKTITLGKEPSGKSKGYCFIEYESPDSASNAIANMQNHIMGGRVIKVARPLAQVVNSQSSISLNEDIKNSIYIPNSISTVSGLLPTTTSIVSVSQQSTNNNTTTTTTNTNENNRIYIGSIHWNVNEDYLRNSFNKFGKILSCTLMQNTETGKHKGYGFIDFDSKKAADDAISLMNGVEILGRSIKVGKPVKGIASNSSSLSSSSNSIHSNECKTTTTTTTTTTTISIEGLEEDSTINSSEQRYLLTQKLLGKDATSKCLVLRNAGSPNDIDETFEEDLRSGCREFGEIEKMVVKADEIVKVYVLFKEASSCQACQSKLNGKYFSYHCIKAEFYDINLFKNNLFI